MTCVLSRNAKFRKKIRGKSKNPLLPKVLELLWSYDSKSCYVLYPHVCLLCPQNQGGDVCDTGSLSRQIWGECLYAML